MSYLGLLGCPFVGYAVSRWVPGNLLPKVILGGVLGMWLSAICTSLGLP